MAEGGYDMKTLIHLGAEFVFATGFFVWTNKQISNVNEKLIVSENRIMKLEEQLRMQGAVIIELERILTGGQRHNQKPVYTQKAEQYSEVRPKPEAIKHNIPKPNINEEFLNENMEEQNENVLDSFLEQELTEIEGMRKKKPKKKKEKAVEIVFEDPDGEYFEEESKKK